jgi:probable mobile endonuclease E
MNYQRIYDNLMKKRIENPPTEKFERHHIVPKSLGGSNKKENIVKLTYREHYIAHLLLCKIYKPKGGMDYARMLFAFNRMRSGRDGTQVKNSRMFEYFREDYIKALSEVMSKAQSGEKNSNYGMTWYYHPELKINKKFKPSEEIPEGFLRGFKIERHTENGVVGGFGYISKHELMKIKEERICEDCGATVMRRRMFNSTRCDACIRARVGKKVSDAQRVHDYEALFEEWKASNLSIMEFAKNKGIANSTLYVGWRKRGIDYKSVLDVRQ